MSSPQTPGTPGSDPSSALPGQDLWARAAVPETPTASAAAAQAQPPGWERDLLEKLAFASLNEQRSARRWRLFWRFSWLILGLALLWALLSKEVSTAAVSQAAISAATVNSLLFI